MIRKFAYILLFVVSIAVVANGEPGYSFGGHHYNNTKPNDLIVGARVPGDRLVLKQRVTKSSSWAWKTTLQQTFNVSRWEKITQVKALDQKTNNMGATAMLLNGGPGTCFATLRFESKRGHGINFFVEIYAKP